MHCQMYRPPQKSTVLINERTVKYDQRLGLLSDCLAPWQYQELGGKLSQLTKKNNCDNVLLTCSGCNVFLPQSLFSSLPLCVHTAQHVSATLSNRVLVHLCLSLCV